MHSLLIVNDDGHGGFFDGTYESAEKLTRHFEQYKGSGVTIFEWCVNSGTKVNIISTEFERFGTGPKTDLAPARRGDRRMAETLARYAEKNEDPLRIAAKTLHSFGIKTFASIRMNPDYGPHWMGEWLPNSYNETFYFNHPEWKIVNRDGSTDTHLSYGYTEVRDRKLLLLEELLQYPIDGVNFDYLRHPPFVGYESPLAERFAKLYGVRPELVEENDPRWLKVKAAPITEFMREARRKAGGRAISVRIDHRFYAEQGLDLQTWIDEGLIDILVVAERGLGGYTMDLRPFAGMTKGKCLLAAGEEAICSGHDLTAEEDRQLAEGKSVDVNRRRLSLQEYRERQLSWVEQGVDGVHIFNDPHRFDAFRLLTGIQSEAPLDYEVKLDTLRSGYTASHCWVHPRAGAIPSDPPAVVMTLQQLQLNGSDIFGPLHEMRTDDLGVSWTGPMSQASSLGQRIDGSGLTIGVSDFTPAWHEAAGKLLGTGHTVAYKEDELHPQPHDRKVAYSIYNRDLRTWSAWESMKLPDSLGDAGAGSGQRVDKADGDILLPIYFKTKEDKRLSSTIVRCRLQGETLQYLEHGSVLTIPSGRGYYEPSITFFGGQYYVTLRADDRGAVTRSADGLHYQEPVTWTWDDGTEVPTYNTQQHWVTHSEGLFLVYTRKTESNGHVFRHRAPLFMAKVDPDKMCLLRETERILVPERGARLGNFAVVHVNERETWVTVAEWMQPAGCEKYGSDNSIYAARICWNRPNVFALRIRQLF